MSPRTHKKPTQQNLPTQLATSKIFRLILRQNPGKDQYGVIDHCHQLSPNLTPSLCLLTLVRDTCHFPQKHVSLGQTSNTDPPLSHNI